MIAAGILCQALLTEVILIFVKRALLYNKCFSGHTLSNLLDWCYSCIPNRNFGITERCNKMSYTG